MRTNLYSAPCAVCDAAVGAMGVFIGGRTPTL
jgi:hypothetical protein